MATWDLQASAGATGKSILWRGTWSSASSYNPYDAVYSGGSSYISKTNNANKDPASNPSDWDLLASGVSMGSIYGLTTSNGTDAVNDINIVAGVCSDSTATVNIRLGATITKQLDAAWAAGNNLGGRDTGAIADATWHVFVIKNLTSGVVDALFSQSATAPTLPSGYTVFRRVGSVLRASATIGGFLQVGDTFHTGSTQLYNFGGTPGRPLSLFGTKSPIGIITFPFLQGQTNFSANTAGIITLAPGLNSAYSLTNFAQQNLANVVGTATTSSISTNLNAEIYFGTTCPVAANTCSLLQYGWSDNRGKDGYSP